LNSPNFTIWFENALGHLHPKLGCFDAIIIWDKVSYEENVNGWKMGANGLWIIFHGYIEPHAKAHLFWCGLGMRSIRPWAQKAMIGSKKNN
jgi:hypothetical protein